jgi:cation diffusion facilitator family transporter
MADMIGKLFKTTRSAALLSVFSNTLLVGSKITVGIFGGSVAVLSEGIHSSLDLVASIIAFISVSLSAQPVDEDHPYGHGKIESVSGTIEAILIIIAGGLIIREAVHKLMIGGGVKHIDLGLAVMLVSVVMNIFVSRALFIAAKKHESQALEADAHHLSTDVMTSGGVLIGLLLVRFTGKQWLDSVVAFGVAALIIFIGFKVMVQSFVDLIDRRLPEKDEFKIRSLIEEHADKFIEYHKMRTRRSGAVRYIDVHLVVSSDQTVEEAHKLCDHIENDITDLFKNAKIFIHLEPEKKRNRETLESS